MNTKRIFALTFLVALIPALTGCSGMAKFQRAIANDPAIVSAQITSVYGTAKLVRVGGCPTNTSVTVSPDGTVTVRPGQ